MNYKEKVMINIANQCRLLYTPIDKNDMALGELKYNRKCHLNSVQAVKEKIAEKVFLAVTIDKNNGVVVHFINKNNLGQFIDNTLGWSYEELDYYLVREIKPNEFCRIGDLLNSMKKYLVYNNSNWLLRKIHRIDYNNFV